MPHSGLFKFLASPSFLPSKYQGHPSPIGYHSQHASLIRGYLALRRARRSPPMFFHPSIFSMLEFIPCFRIVLWGYTYLRAHEVNKWNDAKTCNDLPNPDSPANISYSYSSGKHSDE